MKSILNEAPIEPTKKQILLNFVGNTLKMPNAAKYLAGFDDYILNKWVPKMNFASFTPDNSFLKTLELLQGKLPENLKRIAFFSLHNAYSGNPNFNNDYLARPNKIVEHPELYMVKAQGDTYADQIETIKRIIDSDINVQRNDREWEQFLKRVKANQPTLITGKFAKQSTKKSNNTNVLKQLVNQLNKIDGDSVSKKDLHDIISDLIES